MTMSTKGQRRTKPRGESQFQFRVTGDERAALTRLADRDGTNEAAILRRLLRAEYREVFGEEVT